MVAKGDTPVVRSLVMPAEGGDSAGALWCGVPVSHRACQSGQAVLVGPPGSTAVLLADGVGRLSSALRHATDQARK
jgi:hypothetical protein